MTARTFIITFTVNGKTISKYFDFHGYFEPTDDDNVDNKNSVEEIHSVGTINNVETSYFTQLLLGNIFSVV